MERKVREKTKANRQQSDLISLLVFLENKERRLATEI
jgi:hypothetical protein